MGANLFRPLESGDIGHVAAHLRQADRQELAAIHGDEPVQSVLASSVLCSSIAWTWVINGQPAAIFGVAPTSLLEGQGAPWMLATDAVFQCPGTLVREGRRYVRRMLELFPHLVNYVDARNERSVRWLARVGFTISPAARMGRNGELFHRFEMKA